MAKLPPDGPVKKILGSVVQRDVFLSKDCISYMTFVVDGDNREVYRAVTPKHTLRELDSFPNPGDRVEFYLEKDTVSYKDQTWNRLMAYRVLKKSNIINEQASVNGSAARW